MRNESIIQSTHKNPKSAWPQTINTVRVVCRLNWTQSLWRAQQLAGDSPDQGAQSEGETMLTSLTCEVGPLFQPKQIEDLVLNHFFLLIIFELMVQSSLRVVLWVRVTIGIHTVCTPNEQDHELDEFRP